MLRLLRQHPLAGLVVALAFEAWIALPGEAAIAIAASALVSRVWSLARVAASGLVGMVCNDLVLYALSRAGRKLAFHLWGLQPTHLHLTQPMMVAAKFVPPLRSVAYVIYGIQGASLREFLAVSLLSSSLWVLFYAVLGRRFRHGISGLMQRLESRSHWMTVAESALTLGTILLLLHPFAA